MPSCEEERDSGPPPAVDPVPSGTPNANWAVADPMDGDTGHVADEVDFLGPCDQLLDSSILEHEDELVEDDCMGMGPTPA